LIDSKSKKKEEPSIFTPKIGEKENLRKQKNC